MDINWEGVNWGYVAFLSAITFVAAIVANVVTFRHRLAAAIVSALLFAVMFVFVTYYPHGIPLPTMASAEAPAAHPAASTSGSGR